MSDAQNDIFTPIYSREPTPPSKNAVPWAGLVWKQFTPEIKAQLRQHLATMEDEKAKVYRQYLRDFCDVPKGEI